MGILSELLFDGPNGPFYQAFIESGIAPSFCPGAGYDNSTKQAAFLIGVSNVKNNTSVHDIDKVI